jgi:lactoylglutathione lyase
VIDPKSLMPDWTERKPSIVFESEDMRKTFEEMRDNRGVQVAQEPKEMPWGPFAIFLDPDGNMIWTEKADLVTACGRHTARRR